jgi:thiamine-phosphate pyrophosphorylase
MLRGFYFITDTNLSQAGNISDVKNALAAKVKIIQYREKQATTREMYEEAEELREICKGAVFLINDRVDIAQSIGADGIHIGQEDLPYRVARKLLGKKKIIGVTVHSIGQAREAQWLGADYVSISPVFNTHTKPDAGIPLGVTLIKKIKEHVSIPVFAIGGINLSNAREVIRAGADGLCAISAVITKRDVRIETEKFQRLFRRD